MQYDLWKAIEEMEFAWKKRLLYSCKRKRKARESQQVEIIDYSPEFTKTSSVWTTSGLKYFKLESTDHQSLNHPSEKILQPGGHILMARYNREIVGTCALIKTDTLRTG